MDFFRSPSKRQSQYSVAGPSAPPKSPRKMHQSPIDRLSTVMEDATAAPPTQPSPNRWSGTSWGGKSRAHTLPRVSSEPMPPPYAQYAGSPTLGAGKTEKAGASSGKRFTSKRGGWGKLLILLAILLLVIIALAVGLGVGLTKHKSAKSTTTSATPSSPASTSPTQKFPIGQYSFNTDLTNVTTDCVSEAATWRCYPYAVYDTAGNASGAVFDWVLNNTSSDYASSSATGHTTSSEGVPANMTISSGDNPFGIAIADESLTYINDTANPRLTFSFVQSKAVVPTQALTANNTASICYFNQTQFSATLWLSDVHGSFGEADPSTTSGSYATWPYAVEVQQVSGGGSDVPACYETVNSDVGDRIEGVFTAEPASQKCMCEYKNYDL